MPRHSTMLALCLSLLIGAITCCCAGAQTPTACGPFGNPPAAIIAAVKPRCGDGDLLGPWPDADNNERYACLYEPPWADRQHKLPLIVFLHPSLFPAGNVDRTGLLELAKTFSLTGDPKRPGFIVLAPEGRKTSHHYPYPDNRGIGWDNWYRQLNPLGAATVGGVSYQENADAAAIDHFVLHEVATGKVDPSRIYLSGWSNGAAMALLYALNRYRVAAAAVYSAPNPFGAFDDPCPQSPVASAPANDGQIQTFNPRVPVLHIHNRCDLAGLCPNGEVMANQLRSAGVVLENVIVDSSGRQVEACATYCGDDPDGDANLLRNPLGYFFGLPHHMRWPFAWNAPMLDFFRNHPLK
jgi:poly(3-hydroxybutyrate) depolymerase